MENEEELDNNIEQQIGEGDGSFQDDRTDDPETIQLSEEPTSTEPQDQITEEKKVRKEIDKSRYNKLKRERYEALNALKQLKEENERLKRTSETYGQAAMVHYEGTVNLRMQQAEERLAKAIEDGDVEAQTRAQKELAKVAAEEVSVTSWKEQQKYQQQYQPQQPQYEEPEIEINENMQSWLQENPWIIPDSQEYDEDMADEVIAYAKTLDRRYARSGQYHKISSPEYFQEINNYVQEQFYGQKPQVQSRNISMKPVSNNVSPVGKSTRQAAKQTIQLTDFDKRMARAAGLTDEQYIPYVLAEREKAKSRVGLYGGQQ